MNPSVRTIIFPVKDLAQAKTLYTSLLGTKPYADQPYYVGFRAGEQEIGLDPNGHQAGLTMPVGYFQVDDIRASLKALLDAGAQVHQDVKDVGRGRLIATARDADGNLIGLLQDPKK